MIKNSYEYVTYEGEECVEFETNGKNKYKVVVSKNSWEEYLSTYSWTAIVQGSRVNVKTSINKQSQAIWRVIAENEYDEIDYWGSTVDHINNNHLDNRISNLRIFNTSLLNATNIFSKYTITGLQYIHRQGHPKQNGYKVHYNVGGETFYKHFGFKEYGSEQETLLEAQKYRDDIVTQDRSIRIEALIKKCRDIEFERGLRNKIRAGEIGEIEEILKKYDLDSYKIDN